MATIDQDLTRVALGRQCSVGQLYNVGEDTLSDGFVFSDPQKVEKDWSRNNELNITQIQWTVEDSFSKRLEALDIPRNQKLGLMVDLHDPNLKGYKELINWKKHSINMITGTLTYTIYTTRQTLDMDKNLNYDMFIKPASNGYLSKTTHVINEVTWGARLILTFDCFVHEEKEFQKVRQRMENLLQRIKLWCETANRQLLVDDVTHLDIKVDIHGDMSIPNLETRGRQVSDIYDLCQTFPEVIRNKGRGNPLYFKLFPLSKIQMLRNSKSNYRYFPPINTESLNQVESYFGDIYQAHAELKDLIKNVEETPKCLIKLKTNELSEIRKSEREIDGKIKKQKKIILDTTVNSRMNGSPAFASFRNNHIRNVISASPTRELLDKYRFYVDGLKCMKQLRAKVPECIYIRNGSDLKAVMKGNTEGYVLVYNAKCPDLFQRQEWVSNFEFFLFLNKMKNARSKSFVLCLMENETSIFGFVKSFIPFSKDHYVNISHFMNKKMDENDCLKNRNNTMLYDMSCYLHKEVEKRSTLKRTSKNQQQSTHTDDNANPHYMSSYKLQGSRENQEAKNMSQASLNYHEAGESDKFKNDTTNSVSSLSGVSRDYPFQSMSHNQDVQGVRTKMSAYPSHTNQACTDDESSRMDDESNQARDASPRNPICDDDLQHMQELAINDNMAEYDVKYDLDGSNLKTDIESGPSHNHGVNSFQKSEYNGEESSRSTGDIPSKLFGGEPKPVSHASPTVTTSDNFQEQNNFPVSRIAEKNNEIKTTNDVQNNVEEFEIQPLSTNEQNSKDDEIPSNHRDYDGEMEGKNIMTHAITETLKNEHITTTNNVEENKCRTSTTTETLNIHVDQCITTTPTETVKKGATTKSKKNLNGRKPSQTTNNKNKKGKSGHKMEMLPEDQETKGNKAKEKANLDTRIEENECEFLPHDVEPLFFVSSTDEANETPAVNNEDQSVRCVAKSDDSFSSTLIITNDTVLLNLVCPASLYAKCSMTSVHTWFCAVCSIHLSYGFDQYIYCSSCGKAPASSFSFHCSHPSHGEEYFKFPKDDDLYGMLEKLRSREDLNILVMGETGVGKSTFINAFANYLTYDTFDEAESSELIGLIPTSFTLSDENFEVITVKFGEEDQNEAEEEGASKTQTCKCYSFPCGEKMVRLIDTPGIGDTRGIDQDAKNFVNILSFISNYPKLHGILLLMKPNSSRLSIFFRFCIQELLTHLHKSASENIVFVFTNAKSTFYKPGDTLPPLKKLLKELQDVVIPLHRETLYCLDNDAFRFLVALRNEVKFNEADRKEYSFSWSKTTEECERLLNHIAQLKPHAVKETLSINEARRTICSLAQPLVDILVAVQENLFHINRQLKHIQASKNNLSKLRNNLFVPVVHTEMINLSHPKTVCRSAKCYTNETEDIGQSEACHDPCYLEGLQMEIINNTELKRCVIFDHQNNCTKCGCSWKDHMHIRYEMKKSKVVKKMDSGVCADMDNWQVRQEKADDIKMALEDQRRDYTRELDYVIKASAMFMYFLMKNCLTHQPDVLKDYLDHVVQLEKSKQRYGNDASNNSGLVEALEKASSEYDRELKALQKLNQVATAQEIGVNVSMLYSLPIFGKSFKNIAEHYERGHAQEVALYSERVYVPKKGTGRRQRFNFS